MKSKQIKFKGQCIDNDQWVEGYYFKTPLTDENSGTDPSAGWFFLTGETRHCISSETGVVFVVKPETVNVVTEIEHLTRLDDPRLKAIQSGSNIYEKPEHTMKLFPDRDVHCYKCTECESIFATNIDTPKWIISQLKIFHMREDMQIPCRTELTEITETEFIDLSFKEK